MKKMLALLLVLTLVSLSAFALAEDNPATEPAETLELDRNTMTGTTEVSLTVDRSMDSYTVIIPSKVTIDPKTQYGYGDVVLKAGWELVSVNNLKVQLSGAENGILDGYYSSGSSTSYSNSMLEDNSFQLFRLKNDSKIVYYAIKASTVSWPFSKTSHYGSYTNTNGTYSYRYSSAYDTNLFNVAKGGDNTEDKVSSLTFYVKNMPADPE